MIPWLACLAYRKCKYGVSARHEAKSCGDE